MTVPCITYSQLENDYLIPYGYEILTPQPQDFWTEHDRIMIKKGDYVFPLQFRKKYFYLQVAILFPQLGIPVPEDHQKCYDQHTALYAKEAKNKEEAKKDSKGGK